MIIVSDVDRCEEKTPGTPPTDERLNRAVLACINAIPTGDRHGMGRSEGKGREGGGGVGRKSEVLLKIHLPLIEAEYVLKQSLWQRESPIDCSDTDFVIGGSDLAIMATPSG